MVEAKKSTIGTMGTWKVPMNKDIGQATSTREAMPT
jgi:hypothetical protein